MNPEEKRHKQHKCIVYPQNVFFLVLKLLSGECGIHLVDINVNAPEGLIVVLVVIQRAEIVEQRPYQ